MFGDVQIKPIYELPVVPQGSNNQWDIPAERLSDYFLQEPLGACTIVDIQPNGGEYIVTLNSNCIFYLTDWLKSLGMSDEEAYMLGHSMSNDTLEIANEKENYDIILGPHGRNIWREQNLKKGPQITLTKYLGNIAIKSAYGVIAEFEGREDLEASLTPYTINFNPDFVREELPRQADNEVQPDEQKIERTQESESPGSPAEENNKTTSVAGILALLASGTITWVLARSLISKLKERTVTPVLKQEIKGGKKPRQVESTQQGNVSAIPATKPKASTPAVPNVLPSIGHDNGATSLKPGEFLDHIGQELEQHRKLTSITFSTAEKVNDAILAVVAAITKQTFSDSEKEANLYEIVTTFTEFALLVAKLKSKGRSLTTESNGILNEILAFPLSNDISSPITEDDYRWAINYVEMKEGRGDRSPEQIIKAAKIIIKHDLKY